MFSPYPLEAWKKYRLLTPAHRAPCLLHTSLLVFQRRLGLVLVHAPWVIWLSPSLQLFRHFSWSKHVARHLHFIALGPHASFCHLLLLDFGIIFPQIFHIWWSVLLRVFILPLLQTSIPFSKTYICFSAKTSFKDLKVLYKIQKRTHLLMETFIPWYLCDTFLLLLSVFCF